MARSGWEFRFPSFSFGTLTVASILWSTHLIIIMGDSETECSDPLSECESPILYSRAPSVVNLRPTEVPSHEPQTSEYRPAESETFAPQFESESQFTFPQTQAYSQNIATLDALAGLDSMLASPIPMVNRTSIVPTKPATAKQIVRTSSTTQAGVRVRTLDRIMEKIPKQNISKITLGAQLDVTDMKLLIHACGELVPSKTTKGSLCDKLLYLIESGTLGKVFSCLQRIGVQSNITQVPPTLKESLPETTIEPQPPSTNQLQRASSVRSETQATQATQATQSSSRAVLVAEADPSQWAPVTDRKSILYFPSFMSHFLTSVLFAHVATAALLSQLQGAETGEERAMPLNVEFLPASRHSPSVFFAEQPLDAWGACDGGKKNVMQYLCRKE